MIACLSIPAFALRAALLDREELRGRPVAFGPQRGGRPLVGACTAFASQAGVIPGMRLSEALATCPGLILLEHDPAGAEAKQVIPSNRLRSGV
jgi:nucleotidyltransferase/DNA polymerase involved in DNA repair